MRLAWIADLPHYTGGAEFTQREFLDAKPEDVEVVIVKPGESPENIDRIVVHTVTHFSAEDVEQFRGLPITWFHHDLSPWNQAGVKDFLDNHADHIFCSPMQREKYGTYGQAGICIPPPLDLNRFKPPRQSRKRRKGTCSLAQWRGLGKGPHLLAEWAAKNGPVDVWGSGEYPPGGENVNFRSPLEPDVVPQVLWQYEAFVFLPLEHEPFCRTVAEAHAAGCKVITNNQVGALHYIKNDPKALETAATDFWEAVCV